MKIANIASTNQSSGALSVSQPNQDSHEINIQKQIVNLQGKMRDISYDSQMSQEEKTNEKKELQDKIKNLNNELRQYQIQKRQEEAEKRKAETAKREEAEMEKTKESSPGASGGYAASPSVGKANPTEKENHTDINNKVDTANNVDTNKADTANSAENADDSPADRQAAETAPGLPAAASGAMLSAANTKAHLGNMRKIQTRLEGQMRTASTDEEKAKLQKRLNNVAKGIGKNLQKIAKPIADNRKGEKARKEKVKQSLNESRDKMKNMKASVSSGKKESAKGNGYWDDNSAMPGKVLLTRKKS